MAALVLCSTTTVFHERELLAACSWTWMRERWLSVLSVSKPRRMGCLMLLERSAAQFRGFLRVKISGCEGWGGLYCNSSAPLGTEEAGKGNKGTPFQSRAVSKQVSWLYRGRCCWLPATEVVPEGAWSEERSLSSDYSCVVLQKLPLPNGGCDSLGAVTIQKSVEI